MNIFLLLGILFLATFVLGYFLEKLRIPWIFAALLFGVAFSTSNPFAAITNSHEFELMSNIGLYLLLFLIGFELNFKEILKSGKFIIKATFAIELAEMAIVGTALHFIFALSWPLALIVALSFATVGEAILLPILDELGITQKRLGQIILGIATFDDVFEVLVLLGIVIVAPILIGKAAGAQIADPMLTYSLSIFIWVIVFTLLFFRPVRNLIKKMKLNDSTVLVPIIFGIFCLCIGLDGSKHGDIAVLGATFAGMLIKLLLSSKQIDSIEPLVKAFTYGLFGPIFLFSVGLETNFLYVFDNFWLIMVIATLANIAKISVSYLMGKSVVGVHGSIFMGVALSVRFSTSLVFLKILLDNKIITNDLFSILIGTSIVFKFIIPVVLARLAKKWHL